MRTSSARSSPSVREFITSAPKSWFWLLCVDLYPAVVAGCLPWSTTAVSIFMIVWLIVLLPTLDRSFLVSLKQPASLSALLFFALALFGTLWADSTWMVRLNGIAPVVKFLAIPLLLFHFERSQRGHWVFIAFLASSVLLLAYSWLIFFVPAGKIFDTEASGVPVKNYIDQSYEFTLCAFAIAGFLPALIGDRRFALAAGCVTLIAAFFFNLVFVVLARTALVYMPVLLLLFSARFLSRTSTALLCLGAMTLAAAVWFTSPYLRDRVEGIASEYTNYREIGKPTSTGERLEYWRVSLESIAQAPLFGHGTGSTKELFDREAMGKTGAWSRSIRNPHNQTLYVTIQWGMLGCVILYVTWYFHLALFRGPDVAAWIGLLIVVQNFVSSLLNSHLFDFSEGWIYVLGVGVAGGMTTHAGVLDSARQGRRSTKEYAVERVGLVVPAIVCLSSAVVLFLLIHCFTVYHAGSGGIFPAIATLLLPVAAEIYWLIAIWQQTGSTLNVLTIMCFVCLLLVFSSWTLARVAGLNVGRKLAAPLGRASLPSSVEH